MAFIEDVVIVSAVRNPDRKISGRAVRFHRAATWCNRRSRGGEARRHRSRSVDECIMGNVVQAGLGQNPARQAAIKGGLSNRVCAMTINKVCGSGLKAVALAPAGHPDRQL